MQLASNLNAGSVCSFAAGTNGWLYFCNGVDPVMRWRSAEYDEALEAGLDAPDTSEYAMDATPGYYVSVPPEAAHDVDLGTYKAFVRFLDADTGLPSSFDSVGVEFEVGTTIIDEEEINCNSIFYENIPTSGVDPGDKTIHRQIWRTTAGQQTTYYLDVTIEDDSTTEISSGNSDADLRAGTAMRMFTNDGFPNANRFGVPPDHMAVVAAYQDRLWFAVSDDDDYRRTIMFSESGEPESVPDCNTLKLQDDGDYLTGLMVAGPYLYILARHHIYRLGTAGDPRNDASAPLVAERGCLNQRCWTRVEGRTFLLDEDGPWIFDGAGVDPIGDAIHDYVTGRINWAEKEKFAVAKDTLEETVRFVVALDEDDDPRHCLVYHYRLGTFWVENYSVSGSSGGIIYGAGEAEIDGLRRTVLSADYDGNEGLVYLNSDTYDEEAPIDYELRLGAFQFLPVKQANERRFEIFYDPVTVADGNEPATMTVEMYLDGRGTPESAAWSYSGDLNYSVSGGQSGVDIDLSDTSGYASFAFSTGMARTAPVPRMVEFVLSGTAYQTLTVYEVRITGVH